MRTAFLLLLLAPVLAFGQVSLTGSLDPVEPNTVLLITLHLVNPTTITAQSWGAGGSGGAPGGTNAEGTVIQPGGFDPYFTLFAGTGPAATLITSNDDGVCPPATAIGSFCLDPAIRNYNLPAGSYTLAVSVFENMSFAENLGTGTLGDGFIGIGNYYSTVSGTTRTANYAIDLSGAVLVTAVTQAPGSNPFEPGPGPDGTSSDSSIIGPAGAYQIRYAANLDVDNGNQSVINISNTGAASSIGFPVQNGDMCVSVYAFSPDEQMVSCCACLVTPNGLVNLSVKRDLTANALTPIVPGSTVIELVASRRTGSTACDPGTFSTAEQLADGMVAWGTALHALPATAGTPVGTYGLTETPFSKGTLTQGQLNRLAQVCSFMRANGSGYGICKSCRVGGLGASRK